MDKNTPISILITPKSIFTILFIGLCALAIWKVSTVLLVILTAVVLASFVESLSKGFIRRLKFPRMLAVILVYVLVLVLFIFLVALFVPTFTKQIGEISSVAGTQGVGSLGGIFDALRSAGADSANPFEFFKQLQGSFDQISVEFLDTLQSAFGNIVNVVLVIVISFYLSIEERGVEKFIRAVSPLQYEEYVISVWRRTEYKIGAWFRGQLLQAIILAVLTHLGLWYLGVPYAFMLSILAAILGMIPFGIALAGIAALFVAYTAGGLDLLLITFILYALLQQIENYILQPLIINRVTGLPPLVVLLSVVIGVSLLGFVGLILSIPIAVAIMELIRDHEQKKAIELESLERDSF